MVVDFDTDGGAFLGQWNIIVPPLDLPVALASVGGLALLSEGGDRVMRGRFIGGKGVGIESS